MKVSEILEDARSIVEQGWCKNKGSDGLGNHCALGALSVAENRSGMTSGDFNPGEYANDALVYCLEDFGDYVWVPGFNDAEKTTKQDVLNLFTKAINYMQERGL